MDREIDHCIICNAKEPGNEFSLSNRLNARLEYVTGILPDLSDIGILFGGRVSSPGISNNGGFSPGFSVGEDDVSPWILNDEGSNSGISNVEDISPGMLVIDEDASSRISNNEEVYSPSVSNYEGDGSGMPNGDVGSPGVPNGDEAGSPGMSNEDAGSPGMPNGEAGSPGTPNGEAAGSPGTPNGEAGSPEMLNGEAGAGSPEMPNDEAGSSPRTPNIGGSPSGVSNNGGNSPRISNDEDDSRLDENPPSVKSISSVSSLSDTDLLCHSEDTISAVISPSQQGIQTPTSIQSSLETFFVLKLVFQHPLDHVTTEVMMLLVQSPADWFEICPSCRALVGEGIEMVNALRENHNKEKREHKELSEKLESNLLHLRSKFLYSMFQRICLVSWEFLDVRFLFFLNIFF